ncbi:potassium channel family protein [Novosphingobium mangrovi (ex Huang et al. 2023)]|uniref:NAD-binding protein n=1 Tax=Novosphingobium mangrovi (ex Huang et al. 2023) TaxID=2976432 RepID=A0ABT2HZQ2_9SPHN|nr:potassium channel protein [Novosphingobium mangrovi (ex Huang et al. 2023)]MCT2398031.1 NAD-binding protein [Novosphingobium mangrovi (ex Huang et al. 2023)]
MGSPLQNLARAAAFVMAVFVLSTAGFVAEGWSLGDAAYMVTLTIFSVGYGEVHPIDTTWLRTLDMATIVLGCTGMIFFTGALVQVFAHYQIRNILGIDRMQSQIDRLTNHAIICGYGRIGKQLAHELQRARSPYIILDRNPAKLAEAEGCGHLTHQGDATDEATLRAVGIERARVLATVLPDDALNVFITLSARNLNAHLEIIARGEYPSTEGKLIHAGADKVVLPTHIGAERIAELILYPTTSRFLGEAPQVRDLKRELHEFGLEIEAVTVPEHSALAGATVGEAERRGDGAFFLVQIDRPNGQSYVHPSEDVKIDAGDTVVLVLRSTRVTAGSIFNETRQAIKLGRSYR